MKRQALIIGFVAAFAGGEACDRSSLTPTVPTATPSEATSVIAKSLTIAGNSSLTAIGETSQLRATAGFSDGTVKDVTGETHWTADNPAVATVSSTGLVTAVRFGATHVQASYQASFQELPVRVTPSGTFTVSGWVREPGQGVRLWNVRVLEMLSGAIATTNDQGKFSIGVLTSAHLRFEKDTYEPVEMDPTPNGEDNVAMQRVVRVLAGQTVTPNQLAPHDMDYVVAPGVHCYPCRLIRVVIPAAGTLHLRLTWSAGPEDASLALWVEGQQFRRSENGPEVHADVPVSAGEVIVYAGQVPMARYAVPFMLATSLTE